MPAVISTASRRFPRNVLAALALFSAGAAIVAVTAAGSELPGLLAGTAPHRDRIVIATVVFAAAAISSIVGFAFSALSGAIMFHVAADSLTAIHIMIVASIGIQCYTIGMLSRTIKWRRCIPFLVGGAGTLPLGVSLLFALPAQHYLLVIGAGLVCYGLYMQFRRTGVGMRGDSRLVEVLVGAAGGITGPLAAFPGACIVIWCGMRGWDKLEQRAIYQPYILAMQVLALAMLELKAPGRLDPALLFYELPGVAGAVIGMKVFRSLTDAHFFRAINVALIVSGVAMMLK